MVEMTDPKAVLEGLTGEQRKALMPCAPNRAILPKQLLTWQTMSGHRYPSPKLNNLGYKVRALIEEQK